MNQSVTGNGCQVLYVRNQGVNCFPDFARYQPTEYVYTDASGRQFTFTSTGAGEPR